MVLVLEIMWSGSDLQTRSFSEVDASSCRIRWCARVQPVHRSRRLPQPRRTSGQNGMRVEIATAEFPPSYHRGTIMQVTLAAVCLLSSTAAWLAGATFWWVVAGVLQVSVIPLTRSPSTRTAAAPIH